MTKSTKNKQKIIVILGPTAVGKSDLAVKLAKKFGGEIISADSRQVYKGLDLGTGKITKKEMKGIPHYMLDIVDPKKIFNANDYKNEGKKYIEKIIDKNKIPIICGGTGFYIDALVNDLVLPNVPPNKKLREKLSKKTTKELLSILSKLDKKRAINIDPSNRVRIIRAIEIAKILGKVPKIRKNNNKNKEYFFIGLTLPSEKLKKNIYDRITKRIKKGMIKEIEKLHNNGLSWKRMFELGLEYRYISMYLQNKLSKKEMTEKLFKETWQYSKRQYTWFKKNKNIVWFEPKEVKKIEMFINKEIKK